MRGYVPHHWLSGTLQLPEYACYCAIRDADFLEGTLFCRCWTSSRLSARGGSQ